MHNSPTSSQTLRGAATAPARLLVELWLPGREPLTCAISRVGSDLLIFLTITHYHSAQEPSAQADQRVLLLVHFDPRDSLAVHARVSHHTRERWVLDPLDGHRADLKKLRQFLQEQQPGWLPPRAAVTPHHRSALLEQTAQRVAVYLEQRHTNFGNALEDALFRAAAGNERQSRTCLHALQQFAQRHRELQQALSLPQRRRILQAAAPDYLPRAPVPEDWDEDQDAWRPLAEQVMAQHQAALFRLSMPFSFLVQRLTTPAELPFGPLWLCRDFAASTRSLELGTATGDIVRRVFQETMLADVPALAQDLQGVLEGRLRLAELQATEEPQRPATINPARAGGPSTGTPRRSARALRETARLFTALDSLQIALGPEAQTSAEPLPSEQLEKALERAMDEWARSGEHPDGPAPLCAAMAAQPAPAGRRGIAGWSGQQRRRAELIETLVSGLIDGEQTAPEARPVLRPLIPALVRLALRDEGLFTRRGHPALQAVDFITSLCRCGEFRTPRVRRELTALCQRVAVENRDNPRLFGTLLPALRELAGQVQLLRARNLQRLSATLEGQAALDLARQQVSGLLSQRYAGRPFPQELREALDQGWHQLMVREVQAEGADSPGLTRWLALLHGLYRAMLPGVIEENWESTEVSPLALPDLFQPAMAAYGIDTVRFRLSLDAIIARLNDGPGGVAPGDTATAPHHTAGVAGATPRHWRADELRPGDWLEPIGTAEGELLQLAWKSQAGDRFVVVNTQGQTVGDWSGGELAAQLQYQRRVGPGPEAWPPFEEELYRLTASGFARLARRDGGETLAGLLSRRAFSIRLQHLAGSAAQRGGEHGLLALSLAGFASWERERGRHAAEALLCHCAAVVRNELAENALITRGEQCQLVVVLPYLDHAESLGAAESLIGPLTRQPFTHSGHRHILEVGLGVAAVTRGSGLADLLARAESLAIGASTAGPAPQVAAVAASTPPRRLAWITALGRALEEERLRLRCQAMVPVGAEGSPRHEILLGIADERGQVTAPGELVAAAEHHRRMDIIDRWVIQHCFHWLRSQPERARQLGIIHINLSANAVVSEPFTQFLLQEAGRGDLPGESICFEISESTALRDPGHTVEFIDRLRSSGFRFAIDDFGKHPDSLARLRQLPVDAIKIDCLQLADPDLPDGHRARLTAIVATARFLGMQTLAALIENETALQTVEEIGVDYAQGYGIAKPTLLEDA